jgi:hypothetical protein
MSPLYTFIYSVRVGLVSFIVGLSASLVFKYGLDGPSALCRRFPMPALIFCGVFFLLSTTHGLVAGSLSFRLRCSMVR